MEHWHTMQNPIRTWDMTLKAIGTPYTDLINLFKAHCTKWIFQKEKSNETQYEHYQCRFTLTKKTRFNGVKGLITETLNTSEFHLNPTSNNCIRKNEDYYCTKEDTRIEGPWRNEDTSIPSYYQNITLKPWQQQIVDEINNYTLEGRTINLIVNLKGNEGKSFLTNYLAARNIIYPVPPLQEYKDLMQFMMSIKTNDRPIFIDIPRGLSHTTTASLYSAIETIKSGFLYDIRYKGRYKITNPPAVYVFANHFPHRNYLSWDRWNVRQLRDGVLYNATLFH